MIMRERLWLSKGRGNGSTPGGAGQSRRVQMSTSYVRSLRALIFAISASRGGRGESVTLK